MDVELKEKWIAALRSGEYEQGDGYLRRSYDELGVTAYCCLGVLCNLLDPEDGHWSELDQSTGAYTFIDKDDEYSSSAYIPANLRGEIDLAEDDQEHLVELNDDNVPFNEIADWIEKYL